MKKKQKLPSIFGNSKPSPQRPIPRSPFSEKGLFLGFLSIVYFSASFSLRAFLRENIGARTISWWVVPTSFFWVMCFVQSEDESRWNPKKVLPSENIIDLIFNYIGWFFHNLYDVIVSSLKFEVVDSDGIAFWYGYIILLFGIYKYAKVQFNYSRGVIGNPDYRGNSFFFSWLNISERRKWVFLEPLFILLLGGCMYFYELDKSFGVCLIISALALFWEENAIYQNSKESVYEIAAGKHQGDEVMKDYNRATRKENLVFDENEITGAVLANDKDAIYVDNYTNQNDHKTRDDIDEGARLA